MPVWARRTAAPSQRGSGARAAYVGVDDLAVEEADERGGGPDGADEQGRVDGVEVEADGRVAVQRAEQQPARVGRVGGGGDVAVGGGVGGDGLGLGRRPASASGWAATAPSGTRAAQGGGVRARRRR